jgi:hypothetical protein
VVIRAVQVKAVRAVQVLLRQLQVHLLLTQVVVVAVQEHQVALAVLVVVHQVQLAT